MISRMISPQHVVRDSPSPQSSRSPTLSSPTSPPHANRRRRHKSDPPTNRTDPIIGQVTLSGKFKCLKETCLNNGEDMTFNRHADFKRHYDNTHAGRCVEYFCQEPGCPRSRNPEGGKKGRGFKGRKDKRNEHYKAVHQKESKKRKHVYESDEYAEGRGYEDNTGARPLKVRRRSDTS